MLNSKVKGLLYCSLILISSILFFSCTETIATEEIEKEFNLNEQLTVVNNGTQFTSNFMKLGIVKSELMRKENITTISFKQHNASNTSISSLKDLKLDFYIKDEVLHIAGKPELGITLFNDSPYIISENYEGSIKDFKIENLSNDLTLLLFALDEITADKSKKVEARKFHTVKLRGGCSFSDKFYAYYIGVTESGTESGLENGGDSVVSQHEEETGTSCTQIGGMDTSCIGDSHGCISTKTYCCN